MTSFSTPDSPPMKACGPDPDILMDAGPASDDGESRRSCNGREHDVVREDDVRADAAIVRHVALGEEEAAVPDDRRPGAVRRAGVHGDAFADDAILADDQRRRFALIAKVLRGVTDRGEREDAGARADARVAGHHDMAQELAAVP
jgi:hypothetical protein